MLENAIFDKLNKNNIENGSMFLKEKGITIVSLVVTIIILLILAGVTISMLIGDEGIIARARNTEITQELKQVQEKVDIAIAGKKLEAKNGGDEIDIDEFNTLDEFDPAIDSKYSEYIEIKKGKVCIKANSPEEIKNIAIGLGIEITNASEGNTVYASKNGKLTNYKIYGQSVQNGTPTPENFVEVMSLGENSRNLLKTPIGNVSSLGVTVVADGKTIKINGTVSGATYCYIKVSGDSLAVESSSNSIIQYNNEPVIAKAGENVTLSVYPNNAYIRYVYFVFSDGTTIPKKLSANNQYTMQLEKDLTAVFYQWYREQQIDEEFLSQLEIGSTPTEYRPYNYVDVNNNGTVTTINLAGHEPLRKIGDDADYIDYENSRIVRNIKKVEFTGNENWTLPTSPTSGYSNYRLIGFFKIASKPFLCTNFECFVDINYSSQPHKNRATSYPNTTQMIIQVSNDIANYNNQTSINEWKNYLSEQYANGTPVTVYYVLNTPTEEPIELPDITVNEGKNEFTVYDNNMQASEIDMQY